MAQQTSTSSSSSVSCDIPQVDLIEAFDAPSFENTNAILWMHDSTPRFGHANNLNLLMEGSPDEQHDYMRGIIASSIAMFCFFLIWMICLWTFWCMGPNEAGFLSGRLRTIPRRPTTTKAKLSSSSSSESSTNSKQQQQQQQQQQQRHIPSSSDRIIPGERRPNKYPRRSLRIDQAGNLSEEFQQRQRPPRHEKPTPTASEIYSDANSGRNGDEDEEDNDEELVEELIDWVQTRDSIQRTLRTLQIWVCISTVPIVISSILMSIKGVDSLTESLDDGRESISITQRLIYVAIGLLDQVVEQNRRTGRAVQDLLVDINGICPTVKPDGLCTDINNISTCDFSDLFGDDNTAILETTIKHFQDAENSTYYQEIINVKSDLYGFLDLTDNLSKNAEDFNWALYCAMAGSLCIAALSLLILIGIAFKKSKVMKCLRHWFLVPTFAFLVLFAFLFSMLFVMGSMAVADLCIDSPDSRILLILNRFKEELSPIVVEFASFYINECPTDAIPKEFSSQIDLVLQILPTLGNLSTMIKQSASIIEVICGFNDPNRLAAVADTANEQLCQIVGVLDSIRKFFQCENWFPLYESLLYNGICYNGTDGFAWVAITQFIIVFFSCVLLTLRAAFHDVQEATEGVKKDDDDTEIKCNTTYDEDDTINEYLPTIGGSTIVPSAENNEFEISYPSTAHEI